MIPVLALSAIMLWRMRAPASAEKPCVRSPRLMPTSHYAIICRHGIASDDLVVFMDGDTIIEPGLIAKCAPLFAMRPNLGAVTTDEVATVAGPGWMQDWYALRFAQRRLVMESHSLSRRVLTLTGRLSIFRGEIAQDEEFIRTIETDSLDHWLWG